MKEFFKDKKKLALLSVFMLVSLAACSNPRLADGTIDPEAIIKLSTSWGDVFSGGWFDGIFVYPMAQLINFIGKLTGDAGMAIILSVLIINILTGAMTIKQQVQQQKMQVIKPEMDRIQAKFKGKTDDRSRALQAQELNALYAKYSINPLGSMLSMIIQMPVMFAVYYAVMRAEAVIGGTFMGISLDTTPWDGMFAGELPYFIIFGLMVVFQFVSMKFPQFLQKRRDKKNHVKEKKYAKAKVAKKSSGMEGTMNTMMYVSLVMISVLSIKWPLAMSFYWLVNAVTRVLQSIIIEKFFMKDMTKK
ncbi:MAG: membrane protein insertase YidC [Erysipelotrichaceae bacterium]